MTRPRPKFGTIAIAVYLVATPAAAAEITHTRKADGSHLVTISGKINPGDDKRFNEITFGVYETTTIVLNSPGGYINEAIEIGRRIRLRNWETRVQKGAICNSACTLIWLAGNVRYLDPHARLGFHSAGWPPHKRSESGNAAEAAFMASMSAPKELIDLQPIADPCCVNYVNHAQAKAWGLLTDRPTKQLALPTKTQQPAATVPASPNAAPKLMGQQAPRSLSEILFGGPQQPPPTAARPKITDRIESGGQQAPALGALPATPAQKVVLYEEEPADPNGKRFVGSAIWRTETVTSAPGQPPELAIRADIEVPERKLAMTWTLRRNTDKTLPASHTVEIMFKLPADFPSGGVSNVPGILMKQTEQTRGVPLAGLAVKITPGFYLIGLSNIDADKERNLQLFRERDWFDIPMVYNNNRRAILAMEKGTPGERAFADAFKVWKQ
jgi:hypothetical protein